jgi:hypothetical protein
MTTHQITLGPLLGIEGESIYTVCFVCPSLISKATVKVQGKTVQAKLISTIYSGNFWRASFELPVPTQGGHIAYEVELNGKTALNKNKKSSWAFYQPGAAENAKLAYASCNGFSDLKLMNTTEIPYAMWEKLLCMHKEHPFSVLLMGGDQVYADSAWTVIPTLKDWNALTIEEKVKRKATKPMIEQLDRFYSELYCDRWQQPLVAEALACIPTVMMWDDHDIFDGWGSFPKKLQECDVFSAIYDAAAKHFDLFQLRSIVHNQSSISSLKPASHYSLGFKFREHTILALDNRSERSIEQVMSKTQWADLNSFLDTVSKDDLLLLTAVPVVYRDFSFVEKAFDATPWEEELSDDLKDHWRSREHQGERARLIMRLLANTRSRKGRTIILSGDVHVGSLGIIKDTTETVPVNLHQVVSSGIVHPAPTNIEWMGILATTNDRSEKLDENGHICIDMLKAFGAGTYFRTRNFVTLEKGTDKKLWVNWICENGEKPNYPLN